jgi:hypothetical protein
MPQHCTPLIHKLPLHGPSRTRRRPNYPPAQSSRPLWPALRQLQDWSTTHEESCTSQAILLRGRKRRGRSLAGQNRQPVSRRKVRTDEARDQCRFQRLVTSDILNGSAPRGQTWGMSGLVLPGTGAPHLRSPLHKLTSLLLNAHETSAQLPITSSRRPVALCRALHTAQGSTCASVRAV